MTVRLELFVDNLAASIDFYERVLGFTAGAQLAGGYTPLRMGNFQLSLNRRDTLPADHPIQSIGGERLGRGVEFVLAVRDIEALYAHVRAANWPLSGRLQPQPWGLSDFRLLDPDGYYWRITTRRPAG